MKYNIGEKVWVPKSFRYKKIVDIECFDSLTLLYMNDVTAYPEDSVFRTFKGYVKNIFSKKKTNEDMLVEHLTNELSIYTQEDWDNCYRKTSSEIIRHVN